MFKALANVPGHPQTVGALAVRHATAFARQSAAPLHPPAARTQAAISALNPCRCMICSPSTNSRSILRLRWRRRRGRRFFGRVSVVELGVVEVVSEFNGPVRELPFVDESIFHPCL